MTNSLWRSKIFVTIWQGTLYLLGLSLFTSKSGLQIFALLLILLSLLGLDWKKFFAEEKLAAAVLFLYPLAIVCGFFSIGGAQSALHVAAAWPWPLLVLPTVIVKRRPEDIRKLAYSLSLGLAAGCVRCFYNFATDFHGVFNANTRVPSFWDISRWGLFTGLALIFLMKAFVEKSPKQIFSSWKWLAFFLLLVADMLCFILSNNRGPWLAFVISSLLFLFLSPKIWKVVLPILAIFIGIVLMTSYSRVASIAEVQAAPSGISSKDPSNKGRLNMWKVAADFDREQPFFGTGFENTEESLRAFLNRQTEDYRQKYTTGEYSYRDQHSSYVSMLVQTGALFFLAFSLVVFVALYSWWKDWKTMKALFSSAVLVVLCFHLVLAFFYTSLLSYEVVTFIPFLAMTRSRNVES